MTRAGMPPQQYDDLFRLSSSLHIQTFGAALEKAGPNSVGLFFYAGHGLQLNGRNYLIPPTIAPPQSRSADPADRPEFMADELCQHAVGAWHIKSDAMNGSVQLNADAAGVARISGNRAPIATEWECDAPNRRFVLKFGGNVTHKVTMDGSEKLMFGYDQTGVPTIYTR